VDEAATEGKLSIGEAHCFTGGAKRDPTQLEKNDAWFDRGGPEFHATLPLPLAGFGWFLGDGAVWEYTDPDLSAPAEVAVDGNTGGFNLRGGQISPLKCLNSKISKSERIATFGDSPIPSALYLSVLRS